jgi:hypothetical protein
MSPIIINYLLNLLELLSSFLAWNLLCKKLAKSNNSAFDSFWAGVLLLSGLLELLPDMTPILFSD